MVNVRTEVDALAKKLAFSKAQTQKLMAVTLTQAAYNVQAGVQAEIKTVFRDPSPFIVKHAVKVKQAKIQGDKITPAEIGIYGGKATKFDGQSITGGDQKVTPAHILSAEITGGKRRKKGSEYALWKVMPRGLEYWVPGGGAPLNASHDIPGAFMQRILSAMQTQSDSKANSKIKGSTGINARDLFRGNKMGVTMKNGRILKGLRGYDPTFREQMIAKQSRIKKNGEQAGANFFLGKTKGQKGGSNHILYQFDWQQQAGKRRPNNPNPDPVLVKTNIRPVLVFTKAQTYKARLPFFDIAKRLAQQNMGKIANEQALRLFAKWNGR